MYSIFNMPEPFSAEQTSSSSTGTELSVSSNGSIPKTSEGETTDVRKLFETKIPYNRRDEVFGELSTALQDALENNSTYRGIVMDQYFSSGGVDQKIVFNHDVYRYAISNRGMRGSGEYSLKDREIVVRRKPFSEITGDEWDEASKAFKDPNYWTDVLSFGADFSTFRGAGGVAHSYPGENYFHDPEIVYLNKEVREIMNEIKYYDAKNRMLGVVKAREIINHLRSNISNPTVQATVSEVHPIQPPPTLLPTQ